MRCDSIVNVGDLPRLTILIPDLPDAALINSVYGDALLDAAGNTKGFPFAAIGCNQCLNHGRTSPCHAGHPDRCSLLQIFAVQHIAAAI